MAALASASLSLLLAAPAGAEALADGQLSSPTDVAADNAGNVYVADTYNYRIQKFDSSGHFIAKWGTLGSADGQFDLSYDVATDPAGDVFATDAGNYRVQKFSSTGGFLTTWGSQGSGSGQFAFPNGADADSAGNLYVADSDNDRVEKFDSAGGFLREWGEAGSGDGQFSFPADVAADNAGNVYVTDAENDRVEKFDSSGNFIAQWGSYGREAGQFLDPSGVSTDNAGDVYVADTENNRIQKFDSSGNFITQWGSSVEPPPPPPAPVRGPKPARPRILSGPPSRTTRRSAAFSFDSAQAGVRFQCALSGNRVPTRLTHWRSCGSPVRYTGLKLGGKVFRVRAVDKAGAGPAATYGWRIVRRSGPKPLIIPTTRRKADFRAVCPLSRRCRARVRIAAGKETLARGRYSIPAHSSSRVRIGLTAAGRRSLARAERVAATLTIVDTRTHKHEGIAVVLKRHGR